MPHITFEYTPNVQVDFELFFDRLQEKIVATGAVSKMGVKCRAIASTDHFIIDGNHRYKMVNLLFRMREGRSEEVKREISKIGMELMQEFFQEDIKKKEIILSTEIKELQTGLDLTINYIR